MTADSNPTDPVLDGFLAEWRQEQEERAAREAHGAKLAAQAEAALARYHAKEARQARLAAKVPAALIAEVRRYAEDHYNDGGWDVIVECWEDSDIAKKIAGATTLLGARRKLAAVVSIFADQEADARNSAF